MQAGASEGMDAMEVHVVMHLAGHLGTRQAALSAHGSHNKLDAVVLRAGCVGRSLLRP